MSDFRRQWRDAKAAFLRCGLPTADFPASFVMLMASNDGHRLGPALEAFQKAARFEAKMARLGPVVVACDGYQRDIAAALARTHASAARATIEALGTALEAIRRAVEAAAQPPRPAERYVVAGSLLQFDFAAGLNTRFFAPKPILVEIRIEIDEAMQALIERNQESLRVAWLGDVARAELEKLRVDFQATILAIDAKLSRDATGAPAKIAEANAVLQYYGRIVQDRVQTLVQQEWTGFLARRAYLKGFRIKCGVKLALGTLGIGIAAASLVLSFGTAWINIVAIARTVTELGRTIQKLGQDIEATEAKVTKNVQWVKDRLRAQESAYPGARDRAWEVAKEVLGGLSSFSRDVLRVGSGIQADCEQYLGQISQLERKADELTRQLMLVVDQLQRIGPGPLPPVQAEMNQRTQAQIEQFFTQISAMQEDINRRVRFGTGALEAILALRRGESSARFAEAGINYGNRILAVNGLADFVAQCITNGDTVRDLALALV